MGDVQKFPDSVLGWNNLATLGQPYANQLRRALRRRHGVAFPGGCKWRGALLTGDIIQVVQDRRYISFMRSYPNLIPLGAPAINHILEAIDPFPFDQIFGAWWKANVLSDAKAAVRAQRNVICAGSARKRACETTKAARGRARTPKVRRRTDSSRCTAGELRETKISISPHFARKCFSTRENFRSWSAMRPRIAFILKPL